ncbi:helix-turn-helix domain-containing protein [Paenibacillus qinlingensis]|uniref:helix-turn-helix domain-containing protein n=1 Tax=Paenibacillus qinlingensis TaxID=1837343 RepID=UPI00156734C6|nr:helix-turn-helix domain-containing protein [Paenibacillus qinlingensis]NQX59708.1 helix-turn-helix transcriptional regulator [Paenibacillus qinlingensis]
MEYLLLSRLTRLDVKWVSELQGNDGFGLQKSNPFFELIMVTEGPIYLQVGEEKLELQSGETFLLMPWEKHGSWKPIANQSGFYWVQFAADPGLRLHKEELEEGVPFKLSANQDLRTSTAESLTDFLLLPRRSKPFNRYEILGIFEKIHQQFSAPKGYFRYRASLWLGHILELVAQDLVDQRQVKPEVSSTFLLYRRLVNILDESYTSNPSSKELEQSLHHSYDYLSQLFKRHAGITIGSYIHQLQIQKAKHLLSSTTSIIRTIAEEVGFQDPFYFSRIFKKLEGISPQQFRDSHMHGITDKFT